MPLFHPESRMNLNLEITIGRKNDLVWAQCMNFQDCEAFGQTEEEALNLLGDAISERLIDSVKKVLKDFQSVRSMDADIKLKKMELKSHAPSVNTQKLLQLYLAQDSHPFRKLPSLFSKSMNAAELMDISDPIGFMISLN